MRAGFNWELGPFEMWDAAGVADTVARMKALGLPVSAPVEALLAAGALQLVLAGRTSSASSPSPARPFPSPAVPGHARVADFRRTHRVVRTNPGASLVDLGDGIACIELHSLKNAIGGDVLSLDLRRPQSLPPTPSATLPASSSPATATTSPSAPT